MNLGVVSHLSIAAVTPTIANALLRLAVAISVRLALILVSASQIAHWALA